MHKSKELEDSQTKAGKIGRLAEESSKGRQDTDGHKYTFNNGFKKGSNVHGCHRPRPNLGRAFASRHAQSGTSSRIFNDASRER